MALDSATVQRPLVLVVDDERINRELLRAMLQRSGYDAILASDGLQALGLLDTLVPDLVLLDVVMTPINGFEVLQRIRGRYPDTDLPVIMVTGEADRRTIITAFRDGANDYVTKPLDPEITLARVALHLRLRRSQAELQRSQERYQLAAQGSRIGLWDWDIHRQQIFLSRRWKEMLGFADQEFRGGIEDWLERIHPVDREQFQRLLDPRQPQDQERFECELRIRHRDGNYRWMQCTGIVQADALGRPQRIAGSLADVTEGKVRDVLTGLPNRLLFEERLDSLLRCALQPDMHAAVLFIDLDKFKLVNDSIGHAAGDLLLCNVARRLEQVLLHASSTGSIADSSVIARHGGDEFTILLDGLPEPSRAEAVARQIIIAISEPFRLGAHEANIGCSIGITYLRPDVRTTGDLLREADTAMYHAKTAGRGNCRVYDPEMQTIAAARMRLETEVRQALRLGQFYVVYQPIVRVPTGVITGFEALCRWKHPRGETITPDVFIPILESLGLISELGRYVLDVSSRQIAAWNRMLGLRRPLTVTVNCSTREFARGTFQRDLLNWLENDDLDPSTIRLEVTEGTLMENPDATLEFISQLRARRVGVGLDDFGTGYSSLSYLHRLPLDVLKIDKSFVAPTHRGNDSYEIIRTIIALGTNLNLDIVAEGIETRTQHEMLRELGCTHGQGFFYSPPLSAEEITAQLGRGLRIDLDKGGFLDGSEFDSRLIQPRLPALLYQAQR